MDSSVCSDHCCAMDRRDDRSMRDCVPRVNDQNVNDQITCVIGAMSVFCDERRVDWLIVL